LFDVGAISVLARSSAGEGELLLRVVAIGLIVDEFGAVVGVNDQRVVEEPLTCLFDGSEDVDLRPITYGDALRPSSSHICEA
jgi:hypothetical protein